MTPFPVLLVFFYKTCLVAKVGWWIKRQTSGTRALRDYHKKSNLNYVQECFDRSPSLSRNMDKTLDFKKLYLTNCQNLFQRIDAISTTVGFDFRLSVKISTRQDKKQKNYSCVTSLELVNKNTKVKTVCYVL